MFFRNHRSGKSKVPGVASPTKAVVGLIDCGLASSCSRRAAIPCRDEDVEWDIILLEAARTRGGGDREFLIAEASTSTTMLLGKRGGIGYAACDFDLFVRAFFF